MANEGLQALNRYLHKHHMTTALSWKDWPTGDSHSPQWTSECKIHGTVRGVGNGTHKHIARDLAAQEALVFLTEEGAS